RTRTRPLPAAWRTSGSIRGADRPALMLAGPWDRQDAMTASTATTFAANERRLADRTPSSLCDPDDESHFLRGELAQLQRAGQGSYLFMRMPIARFTSTAGSRQRAHMRQLGDSLARTSSVGGSARLTLRSARVSFLPMRSSRSASTYQP